MTENKPSYVAVMFLNDEFVAVRGGRTTGPWSYHEVGVVGRRLEDEIGGIFVAHAELDQRGGLPDLESVNEIISAVEYMIRACPEEEERIRRQYKLDPLVTEQPEEVK